MDLEQNNHAYEHRRTLLPPTTTLPPIPVHPRLTLDKEVARGQVIPADPVSDWNINLLLGQQRCQQSAVQFHYGERPPMASGNKGKGKRVQAPLGEAEVVGHMANLKNRRRGHVQSASILTVQGLI